MCSSDLIPIQIFFDAFLRIIEGIKSHSGSTLPKRHDTFIVGNGHFNDVHTWSSSVRTIILRARKARPANIGLIRNSGLRFRRGLRVSLDLLLPIVSKNHENRHCQVEAFASFRLVICTIGSIKNIDIIIIVIIPTRSKAFL